MNKRQRKKAAKKAADMSPWLIVSMPPMHRVVLMNGKIRNRTLWSSNTRVRKVLGLSTKYVDKLRKLGWLIDGPHWESDKSMAGGNWHNGSSAGSGYLGGLCL